MRLRSHWHQGRPVRLQQEPRDAAPYVTGSTGVVRMWSTMTFFVCTGACPSRAVAGGALRAGRARAFGGAARSSPPWEERRSVGGGAGARRRAPGLAAPPLPGAVTARANVRVSAGNMPCP